MREKDMFLKKHFFPERGYYEKEKKKGIYDGNQIIQEDDYI